MMRKILPLGVTAIVTLALFFAGCNNDYNATITDTVPALSGPSNLTAHPTSSDWEKDSAGAYKGRDTYAGVVYLTWDPVIDAQGYEIYRKDLSDSSNNSVLVSPTSLASEPNANSFADIVSAANQIKSWEDAEGKRNEYTYTVVAISRKSTRSAVDVVQNGKSEVTVRPYIPASYTVGNVADLTITPITDQGKIRVSWTPLSNPGVKYNVSGKYYDTSNTGSGSPITDTLNFDKTYFDYPISVSEGFVNVSVQTQFGDGIYYKNSAAPASKSAEFKFDPAVSAPSVIANFTVTPRPASATSNNNWVVDIQWDAIAGETYTLEKAVVDRDGTVRPYSAITLPTPVNTSTTAGTAHHIYLVSDSAVIPRTQYSYKVVATKTASGIKRSAVKTTSGVFSYSASVSISVTRNATPNAMSGIYTFTTRVSPNYGTVLSGETVKIYRAEASSISSGPNYNFTEQELYTAVATITESQWETIGHYFDADSVTGNTLPSSDTFSSQYVYKAYIVSGSKELDNPENPTSGSNEGTFTSPYYYLHP